MLRQIAFQVGVVIFLACRLDVGYVETSSVHADRPFWQFERKLDPNTFYIVRPIPESRYLIAPDGVQLDFHGRELIRISNTRICIPIATGGTTQAEPALPLGGLCVHVWHKSKGAPPEENGQAELITFPKGTDGASIRVGPGGATFHCIIADATESYGDNAGECQVRLEKDDGTFLRPKFPIKIQKESCRWTITEEGHIDCELGYFTIKKPGEKKFSTAMMIQFVDGSLEYREMSIDLVRPIMKPRTTIPDLVLAPISAKQSQLIRRIFVVFQVNRANSFQDWERELREILKTGDGNQQVLIEYGLIRDAVKLDWQKEPERP